MTGRDPVIFLPGGDSRDERALLAVRTAVESARRFRMIGFPGWEPHVPNGFSAEALIGDIAGYVEANVPRGPIRIVGHSLGAHLGYAAAARLQAAGREVTGFCAIDGMVNSYPWKQSLELLRRGQLGTLCGLVRSKARHSLIRRRRRSAPAAPAAGSGPREGALVLWLASARSWVSSLDREPVQLRTSTALLRTRPFAGDDELWKRRCPGIRIVDVPGVHNTLFDPRNAESVGRTVAAMTRDWL